MRKVQNHQGPLRILYVRNKKPSKGFHMKFVDVDELSNSFFVCKLLGCYYLEIRLRASKKRFSGQARG